ncbi:protein UBASH3A-like protein [Dinothrombium tinctorium]|uniref:Protein UBASH3A-like protein n=1 Tax=Dinothrombium tinctorium TaxID=1965070 RepID=A0A443RAY9_9ACAR|nr:protein UBASH3A-like protein [Dinothrombium tinctorium]
MFERGNFRQKIIYQSSLISFSFCVKQAIEARRMNNFTETRKLFIIRHGERLDHVFGEQWPSLCFDKNGDYKRLDLNMPISLPSRGRFLDYSLDSPLTNVGLLQATLTGEALHEAGVRFSHVFSSPSFRCVQTAANILKAAKIDESINIEPGLFEWLGYVYAKVVPTWMEPAEIKSFGYNVNVDYKPFVDVKTLLSYQGENCEHWYERSFTLAKNIVREYKDGNILMVAHGGSLDTLTRQLTGRKANSDGDLADFAQYCSVVTVELGENGHNRIIEPPVEPLSHGYNKPYEWQRLLD